MKKLLLLLANLAVMTTACAQNGGLGFNYQALVRNSEGVLLLDTIVNLRVIIYSTFMEPVWIETHAVRIDTSGWFGIILGKEERALSNFIKKPSIEELSDGEFWISIEILEDNGYRELCTSRLFVWDSVSSMEFRFSETNDYNVKKTSDIWFYEPTKINGTDYSVLTRPRIVWGNGNSSTTFYIPEPKGVFLRGFSNDSINNLNTY